jgi:hypothetical protein
MAIYKRKVTRGQSYDLAVTYEESGVPVSIAGDTVFLTTKPLQYDSDALDSTAIVKKTVVVPSNSDSLAGKYTFNLAYADTFQNPGTYWTDVWITRASTGKHLPLTLEKLVITGTPTNRTS